MFQRYDTIDGARCLTVRGNVSQLEAAIDAVKQIGLRQIADIDMNWFGDMTAEAEMFALRFNKLKKQE